MAEVKNFVNWTTEDFVGTWDGVERLIKAGESINLPGFLADHYAKHLVDREMMKDAKDMSLNIEAARRPYLDKCFTQEDISAPTELEAEIAALNLPVKEEKIEETIKDLNVDTDETEEFKEIA